MTRNLKDLGNLKNLRNLRNPQRLAWLLVIITLLFIATEAFSPWKPSQAFPEKYSGSEVEPLNREPEAHIDRTTDINLTGGYAACNNLLYITQLDLELKEFRKALSTDSSPLEFKIRVPYSKVQILAYATTVNEEKLGQAIKATLEACRNLGY